MLSNEMKLNSLFIFHRQWHTCIYWLFNIQSVHIHRLWLIFLLVHVFCYCLHVMSYPITRSKSVHVKQKVCQVVIRFTWHNMLRPVNNVGITVCISVTVHIFLVYIHMLSEDSWSNYFNTYILSFFISTFRARTSWELS